MSHVDALSRLEHIAAVDDVDIDFQLRVAQARDPFIKALIKELEVADVEGYELQDAVVYKRSPANRTNNRNLHSIHKEPYPFDTLHIDHFGPLPTSSLKRKYLLVVVDAFTKFIKLYPTSSTSTRE
uniref:Uncharacterized protein n=1 Tax=Anopheles stephensi TaxID=30069 RepID=A0A182YTC7_ANOST